MDNSSEHRQFKPALPAAKKLRKLVAQPGHAEPPRPTAGTNPKRSVRGQKTLYLMTRKVRT